MSFTKVYPHKNQVEIGIDQLVPFANHSLKLFRGQRLADMVDDIRTLGICQPIMVRPTADGKYEILNGHYRVAAAKELKLDTVPAVILEGLTDEEAMFHVSETNPIGLLLKHGIDVHNDAYKESVGFEKIGNSQIFSDGNFSMALDEYIERFLLTDFELNSSHESIYDMGNSYELDEKECEDAAVAEEIIIIMGLVNEIDIEAEVGEFVHKFNRPGGLIERLNTYLGFDLESFDKNFKHERCKILYLFYMLENKYFPQTNVLMLLSKHSMENIDNSFLGWETSNGKFINLIAFPL